MFAPAPHAWLSSHTCLLFRSRRSRPYFHFLPLAAKATLDIFGVGKSHVHAPFMSPELAIQTSKSGIVRTAYVSRRPSRSHVQLELICERTSLWHQQGRWRTMGWIWCGLAVLLSNVLCWFRGVCSAVLETGGVGSASSTCCQHMRRNVYRSECS